MGGEGEGGFGEFGVEDDGDFVCDVGGWWEVGGGEG